MSQMKVHLEYVSDSMGLEGEINDDVIAETRRRFYAGRFAIAVFCDRIGSQEQAAPLALTSDGA